MRYYLYYKTKSNSYSIYPLVQRELLDFTSQATSTGRALAKGKLYSFKDVEEFHIYAIPEKLNISGFVKAMQDAKNVDSFGNVSTIVLENHLKVVTEEFLNTSLLKHLLGSQIQKSQPSEKDGDYVSTDTINELIRLHSPKYDLCKLIKLLQELNEVYKANLILCTGMLLRAILDHVPPIFNYGNFASLSAQYSSQGNTRSFKAQMQILDNFRNAADSVLHSQIRKTERLPSMIQFEKKTELDSLLQEITRIIDEENKHAS
jgi:hypothetical protein